MYTQPFPIFSLWLSRPQELEEKPSGFLKGLISQDEAFHLDLSRRPNPLLAPPSAKPVHVHARLPDREAPVPAVASAEKLYPQCRIHPDRCRARLPVSVISLSCLNVDRRFLTPGHRLRRRSSSNSDHKTAAAIALEGRRSLGAPQLQHPCPASSADAAGH